MATNDAQERSSTAGSWRPVLALIERHAPSLIALGVFLFTVVKLLAVGTFDPTTARAVLQAAGVSQVLVGSLLVLAPLIPATLLVVFEVLHGLVPNRLGPVWLQRVVRGLLLLALLCLSPLAVLLGLLTGVLAAVLVLLWRRGVSESRPIKMPRRPRRKRRHPSGTALGKPSAERKRSAYSSGASSSLCSSCSLLSVTRCGCPRNESRLLVAMSSLGMCCTRTQPTPSC
jgi:hypothetical protein